MTKENGKPGPEDIDFKAPPENQESRDPLPREIELKIVNLGDMEEFKKKIIAAGGELMQEKRLLQDTGFKLPQEGGRENTFELSTEGVEDVMKLKSVLEYLGAEIIAEENNILKIKSQKDLPSKTARTRIDGEQPTLTVKEKRKPGQEIADRPEIEVDFVDIKKAQDILINLGYGKNDEREKYRTTYKIGETLVEINEGPAGNPWAEIEGPNPEAVTNIVTLLGYKPEDTADISDSEYYRRQGVPEDKLNNLKF